MIPDTVKETAAQLVKQIEQHNELYYQKHTPEISDDAYNALLVELRALEKLYPELVTPTSPTQKVGSKLSGYLPAVKHVKPMLSLYTETDFTEKGAYDFTRRVSSYLVGNMISEKSDRYYCCELKFDGLGISLRYTDGKLTRALTRGDGEFGEDVTNNVYQIESIPKKLFGQAHFVTQYPTELEVRGEIMMLKSVFNQINADRKLTGEKPYANPRNAAAGIMRKLDSSDIKDKGLIFFAYELAQSNAARLPDTHSGRMNYLYQWGFPIFGDEPIITKEPEQLLDYHAKAISSRDNLDFDIDGVVYKVDSIELQDKLGFSGREPRWATAHKFEPECAIATILGIDIQVGRTGKLTPVARITPVEVGGTVVSNVTLHNEDEIKRLGVMVGSRVIVERGGDVIPKIISIVPEHTTKPLVIEGIHFKPFVFPTTCPECGSLVIKPEGIVDYRCTGGKVCPAQNLQSILNFCSRKAMNIQGIGDVLAEQLTDSNLVKTFSDIYSLGIRSKAEKEGSDFIKTYKALAHSKRTQLAIDSLSQLEGVGEKTAINVISAIEESKQTTLPKFLLALGIRYAAEGTAKRLTKEFGSLEAIMNATEAQLLAVDDIGPAVSKSVYSYFKDENNVQTIKELLEFGVTFKLEQQVQGDLPLKSINIVITGSEDNVSRSVLTAALESKGAVVSGNIKLDTDYLIVGSIKPSTEKIKKFSNAIQDLAETIVPLSYFTESKIANDQNWYRVFEKKRK
jgi:DNA ligase (NAD+)